MHRYTMARCETWRVGREVLLERFGEEVEVLAAVQRDRDFGFARLAQLVRPLKQHIQKGKRYDSWAFFGLVLQTQA